MATVEQVQAAYPVESEGIDEAVIEAAIPNAEELVSDYILASYSTTNVHTNNAIESAVIHQVGQWLAFGEEYDVAGWEEGSTVIVGDVIMKTPNALAPRAERALRKAGLLDPDGV